MMELFVTPLLLLLLPVAALMIGMIVMKVLARRRAPDAQTALFQSKDDRKPLNRRWTGYDTAEVARYWGALKTAARLPAERFLLQIDLFFPLLYGAALITSLSLAWTDLDKPLILFLFILPVLASMAADWVENSVLLRQLRRFERGGEEALDGKAISVSSKATRIKLVCLTFSLLLLLTLAFMIFLFAFLES